MLGSSVRKAEPLFCVMDSLTACIILHPIGAERFEEAGPNGGPRVSVEDEMPVIRMVFIHLPW